MKYEGGQVDMIQCLMAGVEIGKESKWTLRFLIWQLASFVTIRNTKGEQI